MPLSACVGILFALLGLGGVGMAIALRHGDVRSPAEVRLWVIGWAMGGLALFCLAVIALRYAKGSYVSIPTSASLIDMVLWGLVAVGAAGFFVALFASIRLWQRRERGLHLDSRDT